MFSVRLNDDYSWPVRVQSELISNDDDVTVDFEKSSDCLWRWITRIKCVALPQSEFCLRALQTSRALKYDGQFRGKEQNSKQELPSRRRRTQIEIPKCFTDVYIQEVGVSRLDDKSEIDDRRSHEQVAWQRFTVKCHTQRLFIRTPHCWDMLTAIAVQFSRRHGWFQLDVWSGNHTTINRSAFWCLWMTMDCGYHGWAVLWSECTGCTLDVAGNTKGCKLSLADIFLQQ